MSKVWQLQEAKNKLSELVETALSKGPQLITRRGKEAVVVVAVKDFNRLTKARGSLIEFFQRSPLKGCKLDCDRDRDMGREVRLDVPD